MKYLARLLFVFSILLPVSVMACLQKHGTFEFSDSKAIFMKGADAGAAYFTLTQTVSSDDKLIGARWETTDESLLSKPLLQRPRVELHDHVPTEKPGILAMKRTPEGVKVSKQEPVKFEQGGKHLMLYNFPESARNGKEIQLVLTFEKAGDVTVTFPINPTNGDKDKPCSHY